MVDTAEDGLVAVEIMKQAKTDRYDMILMDVQMPVMDGYQATCEIRSLPNPQISGIPIIAMTANAFQEDRDKAIEAGMDDYIAKPIDPIMLMQTIARVRR
jgi:CheY-like chemotaxis protein